MSERIGIDVGGTSTDAVRVDAHGRVLARAKVVTTDDPFDGITQALDAVLPEQPSEVAHVALGTTHALNAILARRALGRVAVVRIAGPATRSVPPFAGWPDDLRACVEGSAAIVDGGVEVDGRIHPLDEDAVRRAIAGADAVAITGMFSPQDPAQELRAEEIAHEELGADVAVTLGHRVAGIGLLDRENAAILNAAVRGVAARVVGAFVRAVAERGLDATPYLSQNDGTLLAHAEARALPVLTIGGGASNSIRGAAVLCGLDEGLVIDVGGTSTDVGAITGGYPRESSVGVELGGVETNFRMPDVVSIALGGGTIVGPAIGPESVGARIVEEALVFGGATPTLTDAAVAGGRIALGDPARAARDWSGVLEEVDRRIADAVDRMKLARGDLPLIAVGGGSHLVSDHLPGISEVLRPEHHDVANAIGAATGLIGGEAERVLDLGPDRAGALASVAAEARVRAERAGADARRLETIRVDEVPLAYTTPPLTRVRVRVAGPAVG